MVDLLVFCGKMLDCYDCVIVDNKLLNVVMYMCLKGVI